MAPPGPLLPPPLIRANAEVKQIAYLASVVSCQLYLVESSDGELIMVKRHSRIQPREGYNESLYSPWKTYGFTVYKHDSSNLSWVELKDLGDGMLFLGYNSSLSFSCRDFGGDKSNRIYVTDDFNEFHWKGVKGAYIVPTEPVFSSLLFSKLVLQVFRGDDVSLVSSLNLLSSSPSFSHCPVGRDLLFVAVVVPSYPRCVVAVQRRTAREGEKNCSKRTENKARVCFNFQTRFCPFFLVAGPKELKIACV
ncbi:hypothetical protein LguiA_012970 [Lonicera macranthoides]